MTTTIPEYDPEWAAMEVRMNQGTVQVMHFRSEGTSVSVHDNAVHNKWGDPGTVDRGLLARILREAADQLTA